MEMCNFLFSEATGEGTSQQFLLEQNKHTKGHSQKMSLFPVQAPNQEILGITQVQDALSSVAHQSF